MSNLDLSLTPNQEVILSALRFKKRYGLEILEAIQQSGGKQIRFNSLYPNLKKLEKKCFVKSEWGNEAPEKHTGARRKYYQITGAGTKALEAKQQLLESVAYWISEPEVV